VKVARDRRTSRWDTHRRSRRAELTDAAIAALGSSDAMMITSNHTAQQTFGARGIEDIYVRVDPRTTPEQVRHTIETDLGQSATFIVSTASGSEASGRAATRSSIGSDSRVARIGDWWACGWRWWSPRAATERRSGCLV
jgi:hypothetical protein